MKLSTVIIRATPGIVLNAAPDRKACPPGQQLNIPLLGSCVAEVMASGHRRPMLSICRARQFGEAGESARVAAYRNRALDIF